MSEPFNVLLTSAGRRGSLVKIFQQSLLELGIEGSIFAIDSAPELSAACQLAEAYETAPPVSSNNYLSFLEWLCESWNVKLIVPCIDPELSLLARAASDFAGQGVTVAVSSPRLCDTFSLKRTSHQFFQAHGFQTPEIFDEIPEDAYPVFAKLDASSGSKGSEKVLQPARAEELRQKNPGYVFQEYMKGEEYTVDIFVDSRGQAIDVVPRLRLEVRAGEVSKGKTVRDHEVMDECRRLCDVLPAPYGALNVQIFKTDQGISFTEINPRFGGGFPLTYHAGANMASYLIQDALGMPLCFQDEWQGETVMLRYDAEVILHEGQHQPSQAATILQERPIS